MPLSEHEQRLLEQMERALYAEDPKFASSLRGKDPRSHFRRRVIVASFGFVLGVVLLMTGLVAQVILVSILGFVAMLASVFFAVTSYRAVTTATALGVVEGATVRQPRGRGPAGGPGRGGSKAPRSPRSARPGFMARLEERWDRRRDENGR